MAQKLNRLLRAGCLSLPILSLIIALFLVWSSQSLAVADSGKRLEDLPMNFGLVHEGDCEDTCVQWISAEGEFTAGTAVRFKSFLGMLKGRKLPVVFQSHGGDVDAALKVGRMIRAAGLDTAVGRTQLVGCPMLEPRCPQKIVVHGWSEGQVHGGSAFCLSACPFALAGGKVRAAAYNAQIGLHQVTNGSLSASYIQMGRRNLDAISTRADPKLKTTLSRYFHEMGVNSKDVFAMMGLATPQGLYWVQSEEAIKSGIITTVISYSEEPGYVIHAQSVR